jgi:hypothetical protein
MGLAAVLGIAGCFPFKDDPLQTVQPGLGGGPAVKSPINPSQQAPATKEAQLQVDIVGQKLLAANRQTGLHCMFCAIGTPSNGVATSEVFHRGTEVLFITETLVRKCQGEGQLAAVLAYEMGRMIAEREALAAPHARRPERLPPLQSRIGNDGGGASGPADMVNQAELVKFDQDRVPASSAPTRLPDPMVLAQLYLEKAKYQKTDLDAIAPLLKDARVNDTFERQFNGIGVGRPLTH